MAEGDKDLYFDDLAFPVRWERRLLAQRLALEFVVLCLTEALDEWARVRDEIQLDAA